MSSFLDRAYSPPEGRWRPTDWARHCRVERNPTAAYQSLGIDVAVEMRAMRSKSDQDQTHGVTGRQQHRAKQDRHVVAVARPKFEHAPRRVQELDAEDVACVADVAAHPVEQRGDFAEAVLGRDAINPEDLDRALADIEIFCPLADELRDNARCRQRAGPALWDPEQEDFW